jgi:hypothetical protein
MCAVDECCLFPWEVLFGVRRGNGVGHVLDLQGLAGVDETGDWLVPASVVSLGWPFTTIMLTPAED